jgi:nicotinate-nucleotide adenylyltransferase
MSNARPGAIGVLGGSFDPVHIGHLRLAEDARENLSLESVRWVPTGVPGHRGEAIATPAQRLDMLRLALDGDDRCAIDTAELDSAAPTYTVNTLARLRAEYGPARPLVLIIGSDQFVALHTWRDWERLLGFAHIAVAERPGHTIQAARLAPPVAALWDQRRAGGQDARLQSQPCGLIAPFPMTALEISSTMIREAIREKRSARHLLPDKVLAYIHSHHLYRTAGAH